MKIVHHVAEFEWSRWLFPTLLYSYKLEDEGVEAFSGLVNLTLVTLEGTHLLLFQLNHHPD